MYGEAHQQGCTNVLLHGLERFDQDNGINGVMPCTAIFLDLPWHIAHLKVPGCFTYCPEDLAWPSEQTGSSPVNQSCSTSHVTGGMFGAKEPDRNRPSPALALHPKGTEAQSP